jgi:DNA-binding transcriptional MerR regulator
MATAVSRPQPVEIPNKLYFRIGDVSRLTGVKAYVLRYWETEFPSLSPKKSGTNQRLYRRKDVETVLSIKHLLYEQRYTIEGARGCLQQARRSAAAAPKPVVVAPVQASLFGPERPDLGAVRAELSSILDLLTQH